MVVIINSRRVVTLVAGQGDTDAVTGVLLRRPGALVVEHRFDGHVVRRTTAILHGGELMTTKAALLAPGWMCCTIRNDPLIYLRMLHRRRDVGRIIVHLAPWLERLPAAKSATDRTSAKRAVTRSRL